MYWKEFNISVSKYYKFIIFIIILLTIVYNMLGNQSSKVEAQDNEYIKVIIIDSDDFNAEKLMQIPFEVHVNYVDSIEEAMKFSENEDVILYVEKNQYKAYINPHTRKFDIVMTAVEIMTNEIAFKLEIVTRDENQSSVNENQEDGFTMFFTILTTAILLLAYKLVKDDDKVKAIIVYSPEKKEFFLQSKIALMACISLFFSFFYWMLYEESIYYVCGVFILLLAYSIIGMIFGLLSSKRSLVVIYWITVIGLTIGQLFTMRVINVDKVVASIESHSPLYFIVIVIILYLAQRSIQRLNQFINMKERIG